ncbi:MAG: HDOD domain-containing protein, partial [Phycisphaerae bacterium]
MRDQQPSPANTPIAGPSADYVLAQLESAGAALEFSSELLDFDRFHTDDLRNRLLAQYDGGAEYTRLRAFCKSSATNLLDLIESFGPHATVCNLLTLALARRYSPDALAELSREALDHWIRTLSIACAARRIAALRGSSTESMHRVYAAGLLHEVGVFVLMESFPRAVRRALDRSRVAQKPINVCEVEILGTDHLVIGRRTLLRAAMPEWLIDAAWLHER